MNKLFKESISKATPKDVEINFPAFFYKGVAFTYTRSTTTFHIYWASSDLLLKIRREVA